MRQIVPIVSNKNTVIWSLWPHYSNSQFDTDQTTFLAPGYRLEPDYIRSVKGIAYDYSDRLWQWDWNKADQANKAAREQHEQTNTAAFCETFLRLYFDKPNLVVVHLISGVNRSNGYPYVVYGYLPDGVVSP